MISWLGSAPSTSRPRWRWIYLVGPAIGALVAVSFEWILRGKATTAGGAAAQGILNADDPNAL